MIEPFSAGYWIVPSVEAVEYSGERAIIQDDIYFNLLSQTGQNTIFGSVGGTHFEIYPERSVPDNIVAVPKSDGSTTQNGDPLLITKQDTREIFCSGGFF